MPFFELLFRKHRDKTVLGILILFSLTLLILPQHFKFEMARSALNAMFLPVEKVTQFFGNLRGVQRENRSLRRMVASLMLEREKLLQYRDERERLRRLAEFKEEQFFELTPCEVIGQNLDRFQTMLVIDKGESDSIRVRMPVLSYEGYVGRVVKVFKNTSWVQLICSRSHPISCINKRSRVVGILEWKNRADFEMKNVGVVEDIRVGDTLITSGFGGVVPKGFPVAVVTDVSEAVDGVSRKVDARSDINLRTLEDVFVVTGGISWERSVLYDEADSTLYHDILRSEP